MSVTTNRAIPQNEPKAQPCGHCDFSSGTRGMDRCSRCDGTGSVFRVGTRYYPNTKEGYYEAAAALWAISPPSTPQAMGGEWKLVPVEPTEEMYQAATSAFLDAIEDRKLGDWRRPFRRWWDFMLAAAPSSPAPASEAVWNAAIERAAKEVEIHLAKSGTAVAVAIRALKRQEAGDK